MRSIPQQMAILPFLFAVLMTGNLPQLLKDLYQSVGQESAENFVQLHQQNMM
jgi:hypothetical protein